MEKEKLQLLKKNTLAIAVETESIQMLIKQANDSEFSKIVDLGKLKSEIDKYCDNVLGSIEPIRKTNF